jgi:glycosyltransferase involved in cell wall biosynthesis
VLGVDAQLKVAMINDCAFVGETLLKYLPADIEKEHIKRSRGLWSKTFGIAYKVFRAEADVYHAHYLLQDCYIANRLGKKPLVGHAHGSDLRSSLQHKVWGRIVRHNLKKCDKVLVSTPDVLGQAKAFRKEAEYLPNPVDKELFYPKPPMSHGEKTRVLIASDSNWAVKGTDIAIKALANIKENVDASIISTGLDFDRTLVLAHSLGLSLRILEKKPHHKLNEYYWNADVVIDRFTLGSMGMVSLEAIACGRPALAYVSSEYPENSGFPLKDLRTEEKIAEAIVDLPPQLWKEEHAFVERHHDPEAVVSRLVSIYGELIKG